MKESSLKAFIRDHYRDFSIRERIERSTVLTLVLNCLKFLDDYTICQRTNAGAGIIEKMFSLHFQ